MPVTPRPPKIISGAMGFEIHSLSPIGSTTGVFFTGCLSATDPFPSVLDCQTAAIAIAAWVTDATGIRTQFAPTNTFDYCRVWSLAVLGGPEFTQPIGLQGESGSSDCDSYVLAAQLIENTDQHRRNAFGRIYQGPLPGDAIDRTTQRLKALFVANALGFWTDFQTRLGAAGFPWVVGSGVHGVKYAITGLTMTDVVAVQSRRGNGRD